MTDSSRSCSGDAERPDGQPVGDRVLHRLEAALEPPSTRRDNLRLGRALDPGGGTGGVRPGGRGGTGAGAVATPTTPPAGHDAGLTHETDDLDRR